MEELFLPEQRRVGGMMVSEGMEMERNHTCVSTLRTRGPAGHFPFHNKKTTVKALMRDEENTALEKINYYLFSRSQLKTFPSIHQHVPQKPVLFLRFREIYKF
jgi:hypothetical protein